MDKILSHNFLSINVYFFFFINAFSFTFFPSSYVNNFLNLNEIIFLLSISLRHFMVVFFFIIIFSFSCIFFISFQCFFLFSFSNVYSMVFNWGLRGCNYVKDAEAYLFVISDLFNIQFPSSFSVFFCYFM